MTHLRVKGTVARAGRREHLVRLDTPHEGVRMVTIGYMAGITGLVFGQEVDWPNCKILAQTPTSIFVGSVG